MQRFSVVAGTSIVLLVAMSSVGSVMGENAKPINWRAISDKGEFTLVLSDSEDNVTIPISTSTTFPTNTSDSNAPETAVMRGYAGPTAAIVIVKENVTHVIVNSPDGKVYKVQFDSDGPSGPDSISSIEVQEPFGEPLDVQHKSMPWNSTGDNSKNQSEIVHLAPKGGGSIEFSKYIWDLTDWKASDPVNVIFYDGGWESRVEGVLGIHGWTAKGGGWWCSSGKDVHIHDAMHGGQDAWFAEDEVLVKPDKCEGDRYHMRLYESESGDTHSPGFVDYSLGPVHWEEGSTHSYVDPQQGQDRVAADLANNGDIGAIHSVNVGTSSSECSTCDNWGGAVDLYQIYPVVQEPDPCGGTPFWYDFAEGDVVMLNLYC